MPFFLFNLTFSSLSVSLSFIPFLQVIRMDRCVEKGYQIANANIPPESLEHYLLPTLFKSILSSS